MREVSVNSAAIAIILTAIFLAYSLARFLTDAASGLLNADEVALLTLYKSIIALEVLLPLALYFGILGATGRLNAHNELVAMRACGLRTTRLGRPPLAFGLLLAAVVGALSVSARPWAYDAMYELRARAQSAAELNRIKAGRFYLYEDDARTVYIEHIGSDSRRLRGVFIRTRGSDALEIISAPRGELEAFVTPARHRLVLYDASIFRYADEPPDLLGRFDELTLSLSAPQPDSPAYRVKAAPTPVLWSSREPADRAELQWRLSTPLSTVLLVLTALTLVDYRPRHGRFARVPLAVGIYAVYYNLLGVNRTWVEQGVVAGLWWAPVLLAGALATVVLRRYGWVRAPC